MTSRAMSASTPEDTSHDHPSPAKNVGATGSARFEGKVALVTGSSRGIGA